MSESHRVAGDRRTAWVSRAAILLLLAAVVVNRSMGRPEWFDVYALNTLFVLVVLALLCFVEWQRDDPSWLRVGAGTAVSLVLIGVLLRQGGAGIPEFHRQLQFLGIFLLFLAYPLFHHDVVRFLRRNAVYLLAFAVLFGVYLLHGSTHGPGSGFAAFPIASGFLLVTGLFVVPRYVRGEDFLWAVGRVSAVVVLLGLGAYLFGEYTAVFLPVHIWPQAFSPPFLPIRIHSMQSIFVNPNDTGLLLFVGAFASFVEAHRAYERWTSLPAVLVPAGLFLLDGLGLYLSYGRSGMLAAGIAAALYLSVGVLGREYLPHVVVALVGLVTAFLLAMLTHVLPVNPGHRFALWTAGIEALARAPTLLGHGIVSTGDLIAPFLGDQPFRGSGVHNSYLTTALRAGLLGVAAHLVLAVGSVVHRSIANRSVDVAMLALALGFAVHQLFESYTLFQHSMGSILAALAVGYVITESYAAAVARRETHTESIDDVFGQSAQRSMLD